MMQGLVGNVRNRVRLRTRLKQLFSADHDSPRSESQIIDAFHQLYYDSKPVGGTWAATFWLGTPAQKCPLDLWIYQEIMHELEPDLIIETGTAQGGSALFLASICDLLGNGRVVSIDIAPRDDRPVHPRTPYYLCSSTLDP